jgi:dihydroorotate dehydrogenase
VKRLEKRRSEAIVGVNIGKNFDTPNESAVNDYAFCLKAAYRTADYITVNISSPNTKGLRDLQAEDAVRHLLTTLKTQQASLQAEYGKIVPLLVKIAPDLNDLQIESLARVINEINLDGVIATNTTIDREVVAGHPLANEAGGLSGAPVRDKSTLILQAFRRLLKPSIPLVGVGGILDGRDASDKIQHGAELVQIYSGLVFRGPALIRESLAALSMK